MNTFVDLCEEWFVREEGLFGCSGSMKTHILMITEGWSVSMEKDLCMVESVKEYALLT